MNNKTKTLILIIAMTLVTLISSSYALLRNSSRGNNSYTMNVGNLEVNFLDNLTNGINLTNAYPMSDTEGMEQEDVLEFAIKNNGNMNALYDVYIDETSTDPEFKTVIRHASSKDNGVTYSSPQTLSENKYIEENGIISVNEEISYKVKIWLAENADSTYMNKIFTARVVVEALQNNNVVIFDANGGTVPISRKNVKYGESYGDLPIPTREGYNFAGWAKMTTINSSGTQKINTLVNGNNDNLSFEIKYEWIELPETGKYAYIFGNYVNENTNTTRLLQFSRYTTYSNINTKAAGGTNYLDPYTRELNTIYLDKVSKNRYETNTQVQERTNPSNGTTNEGDIYLFSRNATATDSNAKIKLYYLKVYDNNELQKYFEPYKNLTTGEIGLIDNLTGDFYGNSGNGEFTFDYEFVNSNSVVNTNYNHELIAIWDNEAPTLELSKITYKNIPFDNTWTYTNSSVTDGVLNINEDGSEALSDYIDVNGGFYYFTFDGYGETGTTYWNNQPGSLFNVSYYDLNKASTTAGEPPRTENGHSCSLTLNEWKNNVMWASVDAWKAYNRYGDNIKYIRIRIYASSDSVYSIPPVKYRNLKVYGESMPNDFYLINVTANDNSGIKEIKYAKGNQNIEYFRTNGNNVIDNQIRVEENGTYTVYVKDLVDNEIVDTIEITNIE